MTPRPITVELPEKLQFLWRPARYKVVHGGRGGAKSWSIARALLTMAMGRKMRVLCARELQLSIADSVHKLLCEQIEALGYSRYYDTTKNVIRCSSGSEFIFAGLKTNVTKIKSMEGVDVVWVEEAEAVSDDSWKVLIPTIRKEASEIWVSYNPNLESDATYQRFQLHPPPGAVVVEIGWQDNPWFPEVLGREKDHLYAVDPDAAANVWGGETRTISKATVLYGKWIVEPFVPGEGWDGPYQGVDWGFSNDPSTLVRCWITTDPADPAAPVGAIRKKTLWIEHEAYGVGVDVTDTPALFDTVPDAHKYVARADSARPETISYMQQHGYPLIEAATKGAGSVEDGVSHLRGYGKIVIHSRCVHTREEAGLWSYKKNSAGDVLPILLDKHNHCWDAVRYALEPVMRSTRFTLNAPINLSPEDERGVVIGSKKPAWDFG